MCHLASGEASEALEPADPVPISPSDATTFLKGDYSVELSTCPVDHAHSNVLGGQCVARSSGL